MVTTDQLSANSPGEAWDGEAVAGDVFVRGEEENNLVLLVCDGDKVHQAPEWVSFEGYTVLKIKRRRSEEVY